MRTIVILNAAAGSVREAQDSGEAARVQAALERAGVEAQVRRTAPERLQHAARQAADERPDAVVSAGGDGTIGSVASALVGGDVPLGVLAMGTRNHFAKDAGLPLGLDEAAKVIAGGVVRAVDVAEVNGRIFVNNSSIGLYPSIVRKRDQMRQRLGRSKLSAMIAATLMVLRRHATLTVQVQTPHERLIRKTPILFVGNNEYQMELLNLGQRASLNTGKLSLYLTHRAGRFGLLWLGVRGLFGKLDQAKDFESKLLDEFLVETKRKRVKVAIDGEVTVLNPPLRYRVLPGGLKLVVKGPYPPERRSAGTALVE